MSGPPCALATGVEEQITRKRIASELGRSRVRPWAAHEENSSFRADSGSGLCPLLLSRRGFEPCEDART